MIAISSKGIYGVAALFELALSHGKGCSSIDYIAGAQGIPSDYLRQLLIPLKKAGLVKSVRGAAGGYALARPPASITVREILEALEGPIVLADIRISDRTLRTYWADRQFEVGRFFESTIEDLIHEKQKHEANITYHI